jgi:hypothetical protein
MMPQNDLVEHAESLKGITKEKTEKDEELGEKVQ